MNDNEPRELLFSLKGVDLNDDDALKAFAQHVWEEATAAFGDACRPLKPEESFTKQEGQTQ